jgi:sulfonate transport system substrate-binding protein
MRLTKYVLAAAVALPLAWAANTAGADPLKIRVSYVVPVANWMSILYEKKDVMTHIGKSYDVEVTRFQGTTPMITALGANELDIADLAYSSYGLAIENAGMDDLRVIGDEAQDGTNGHQSGGFYVKKDSPIQKVEDLKGKVIASVGAGTAVDIAIRAMLAKKGMQEKRDYTMVEAGFPAMKAMLLEDKVQLVPAVQPFSADPEFVAKSRVLFTNVDALDGPTQYVVFVAKDAWLKKNKAAVVDWMEDAIRAIHWYQDPKNRDAAIEIAARVSKQPKENFGWIFSNTDNYRSPDMLPNLDSLQHALELQQSLGFLKTKIDVKKHADLSYVQEAAARVNKK